MSVTKENFPVLAKSVPLGQKRKVLHCGSTPSLSVSSTLRGWSAYCHRCAETMWHSRNSLVSREELAEWQLRKETKWTGTLPEDFTQSFEVEEVTSYSWMTWVLRGGISQDLRSAYSLGWSPALRRAIIPLYETPGVLSGYLTRRVRDDDPDRTKYRMIGGDSESLTFSSLLSRAQYLGEVDRSLYLCDMVLVEDPLSAIRVGEYLPTHGLLGTSRNGGKLGRAISACSVESPRVGVWLDPDSAGRSGTAKAVRMLRLMGLTVIVLSATKDPKNLTNHMIQGVLTGDRYHLAEDYAVS